jgi:putative ABC transport system permease protein
MEAILQDIRYAARQLRNAPGFALTAILTLALAIGANTAIFSLLDQALLRLLPVHDPRQLVVLQGTGAITGSIQINGGAVEAYFSYPMYQALRDKSQVFDGLIGMDQTQVGLSYNNRSDLASAELVTGNYFNVLGVPPAIGRVITPADDVTKNGSPVAVLSFNYWRSHFGSNPSVLGQTVSINSHPFQIIGVSAPGFQSAIWGSPADLFVPITMKPQVILGTDDLSNRRSIWMNIIGRLKPGISAKQAQASLAPLWHAERADELKTLGSQKPRFVDRFLNKSQLLLLNGGEGFSYQRDTLRTPLLVVMGMVILVILMACVNVASLVLVRAAARTREFSMRYALGAKRSRMIQQLLIEGLLIGLAGGAAALILAPAATHLLLSRMPITSGEPTFSSSLDSRILLFNFAVAAAVSLLFSLAPVMQFWKPDLVGPMKSQSSGATGGRLNFRRITVGLQIGISLLLLVCSGLFVRTLHNLRSVDVGFNTEHIIQFAVDPAFAGYAPDQVNALHKRIATQLSALPGVRAVTATDNPELTGNNNISSIKILGYTPSEEEGNPQPETFNILPGYFAAMQVPLIAGRTLTEQDDATHPKVVVVNQNFAKKYFGSAQAAIGRQIAAGKSNADKTPKYDTEIVGVVHDSVHQSVDSELKPALFRTYLQNERPAGYMMFYVRTYAAPEEAMNTIRQSMQQLDSKLVLDSLRTLDSQINDNISSQRIVALLAVGFGLLATLLAAIGLYGVLAYSTAQRTREIGIRMALGSDRMGVVRLMLLDVFKLAGLSILVTIPIALLATHYLKSQLYHVSNTDPAVFALVSLIVALVVLIAAALPAKRAASTNPSKALRAE